MGWEAILPSLISLATLVGLVAKVIFDALERKQEAKESASNISNKDAETARIHSEISASYAEEIVALRDRMENLEKEVERQNNVIKQQAKVIHDLRKQNSEIQKRADALERQVVELGGVPYNHI